MTWICSGQYQRRTAAQRLVQEIRLFGFQRGVASRWAAIRPRPQDVVRQQRRALRGRLGESTRFRVHALAGESTRPVEREGDERVVADDRVSVLSR